ncbi:MAG TPA: nucleotidyl transferase AbiEii/AbiGii toxin family protein [Thermoanaerobaculia bacterium]|nr:nucleotidyl transferase AbiEii/AbiGii toxin family protein [Thermoanaerobaculia bacterium]
MNFGNVLGVVTGFLEEKRHRYALIGGIALASYGLPRTTVDVDLLVDSTAQDDLIRFLESQRYETLNRSRGYSNHLHANPDKGSLDFVYVGGETADKLFANCRWMRSPGEIEVPVPKPEHLAALKVLAMKNDPARTFQEMADIRFLLTLPGVDRKEIRDYFERQGLTDRYDELERTL